LRILLVHRTIVDYTAETPYRQGLGGTESALAYLATQLAELGHAVQLLTNTSTPGTYRGVECLNHRTALNTALLNAADIVVVSNESAGRELKEKFKATKPLVLWCQHADDQPAIAGLEYSRERKAWAGFAFVSQWQRDQFGGTFWLPPEKCRVMPNAVAPAFAALEPPEPWFAITAPPILVYTSAAYRGLDVLLDAFPSIRANVPGARLRVFSSLSVTRGAQNDTTYAALHRRCLDTEGVDYVGPVGQSTLARELKNAAALAYPSTFAETSCIAAMEAMAAGALVISTKFGALPETLAGFGRLIDFDPDPKRLAAAFARTAIDALSAMQRNPDEAAAARARQIAFVRRNYTWPTRAQQWQTWLTELTQAS
jgi:glycosyltransferase involved in cell wall biosynthesis